MKRIFLLSVVIAGLASCSSDKIDRSDPLTTGRGFIEASLKSDYVKAEKYLLQDSTNDQYLDRLREFSMKLTPLERENYRDANIIIDSTRELNDSTNIIYYKNTYKKEPTQLRIVKKGNDWVVDFKYTFLQGNEMP